MTDPTFSKSNLQDYIENLETRVKLLEDYITNSKLKGKECPRCGWLTMKVYDGFDANTSDTNPTKWKFHTACGCGYTGPTEYEPVPSEQDKFMMSWKLLNGIKS